MDLAPFKKAGERAGRVSWHFMTDFSPSQRLKDGLKLSGERAGKRAFPSALRGRECDCASLKVHQLHDQGRLAEAAARMLTYQKRQAHPFGFNLQGFKAPRNLLVQYLSLFSGGDPCDTQSSDRVGLCHSSLNSDPHDLAEKLGVLEGRVTPAKAMPRLTTFSPLNEFAPVTEFNHRGVRQASERQPVLDMPPAISVSDCAALVRPAAVKPPIHPSPASLKSCFRFSGFGKAGFRAQNFRLRRLDFALAAQSGRIGNPSSVRPFPFQKPERAIRSSVERGHNPASVTL